MKGLIMKKQLLIFDIDGTLCDINQPIQNDLVQTLQLVSIKHQVVLASGKPFGYIAGFVRQLGLKDCMIIGENGATLMYNANFPPNDFYMIEVSDAVQKQFIEMKRAYTKEFKQSIWFQPNDVNLTVFPINMNDISKIHEYVKNFDTDNINVYFHKDSVDFTPKGFDKGSAVDVLLDKLGFSVDDLHVFGDSSNDIPMLVKTKNAYLINSTIDSITPKKSFENYRELSEYLTKNFVEG